MAKKRGAVVDDHEAAARLRLADVVFNATTEGVLISDAKNRIVRVNRAFTTISGFSEDEVIGEDPAFLASGRHDEIFYKSMWDTLARDGSWHGEVWNRRKNGEVYPEWMSITAIKGDDGLVETYVAVFSDISRHKREEDVISYQDSYDALTGLPNRWLIQDRIHRALEKAKSSKHQVGVMYLDIDNFKLINDSLGHDVGDALLVEMGKNMKACLRDNDTIGRLEGDKYLVLLPDIHASGEATMVARRLREAACTPMRLKGQESDTLLSISIGIAIYPNDGKTAGELIRNADTAAFHAKEQGRDNYQFFTEDMNTRAMERLSMENMLRRSLELDQFVIHYQPKVDLRSGKITGVEALLRWARPDIDKLVLPETFIPLAEETGLIIPLGDWVIKKACLQAKKWYDAGVLNVPVAVNLSACQLSNESLISDTSRALKQTGLDPSLLEMEITETALMENAEEAIATLQKIHDMGIRLAADDFGTGYSSLSYLSDFPLNAIKIDGSFIAKIRQGQDTLAAAVIAIGKSLAIKVIAEGVEYKDQLTFLRQQCCDEVQGFIFSKPLPDDEILQLLLEDRCFNQ